MKYLMIVGAFVLAGCQPAPEARQVEAIAAPMPQFSGSMVSLLNTERAGQGRGRLVEDPRLSRAALDHAEDMVRNDCFSHQGQTGSSFTDRARAAGYTCAAAENIAFGQRSEIEVVTEWMDSPGHRRNILLRDATEFGIGRVGNMWVLMLGRGC